MKIKNDSQEFNIQYNSKVYTIPEGEMEITDEGFATFIVGKAKQWGYKVIKTGTTEQAFVKPLEVIPEVKEEIKKEVKEEIKEKVKTKK